MLGQAARKRQRRRPAYIAGKQILELAPKLRVVARLIVRIGELLERVHQGLRHKLAAVGTKVTSSVRQLKMVTHIWSGHIESSDVVLCFPNFKQAPQEKRLSSLSSGGHGIPAPTRSTISFQGSL